MVSVGGIACIALGGALGAVARYIVSVAANNWMRKFGGHFPLGTLMVNVIGSFLFGLLLFLFVKLDQPGEGWKLFALTGFMGAFTTFSTFSFETVTLVQSGQLSTALVSVGVNVCGSLLAFWMASRISAMMFT